MYGNKQLTFFAGINGAGKTTLYQRLLKKIPQLRTVKYINPDMINEILGGNFPLAMRAALTEHKDCIDDHHSFVFESTFTGSTAMNMLKHAKVSGYAINGVLVGIDDLGLTMARIESRVIVGGHYVKTEEVIRRKEEIKENYDLMFRLADRLFLVDNSGIKPVLKAVIKNQQIIYCSQDRPRWVEAFLAEVA